MNHSPVERTFTVRPRLPERWMPLSDRPLSVRVPPREEGAVEVAFRVPADAPAGIQLVTADVSFGEWELREWTEAMVTVAEPGAGR